MRILLGVLALLVTPLVAWATLAVRPTRARPTETVDNIRSIWFCRPPRWCASPPIPESLLLNWASQVISRIDLLMTFAHARRMRFLLSRWACELPAIYPAWPETLRSLWTGGDSSRHLFVITPETSDPPKCCIIFLHGHGGNSILYPQVWQKWATHQQTLMLFPSFGYGNWESPKSILAVEQAIHWAKERYSLSNTPVFLAGISQGGAGVIRCGFAMRERVTGLILLSPTLEPNQVINLWNGFPMLIVQGTADHNVSFKSVQQGVAALQKAGAKVTTYYVEEEDHFLFFAQREKVFEWINAWKETVD